MARTSEARLVERSLAEPSLYGRDVHAWALEQASRLRDGRLADLDLQNVAEEIESVGRSERNRLESHLVRIVQHLLKWDHQPGKRTMSWWHSVNVHRVRAAKVLRNNPSLRSVCDDILADAFDIAVADAMSDTHLERKAFLIELPYTFHDVMQRELAPLR